LRLVLFVRFQGLSGPGEPCPGKFPAISIDPRIRRDWVEDWVEGPSDLLEEWAVLAEGRSLGLGLQDQGPNHRTEAHPWPVSLSWVVTMQPRVSASPRGFSVATDLRVLC
jgi:hypothetical protein